VELLADNPEAVQSFMDDWSFTFMFVAAFAAIGLLLTLASRARTSDETVVEERVGSAAD
jgi:hypothetical protein